MLRVCQLVVVILLCLLTTLLENYQPILCCSFDSLHYLTETTACLPCQGRTFKIVIIHFFESQYFPVEELPRDEIDLAKKCI